MVQGVVAGSSWCLDRTVTGTGERTDLAWWTTTEVRNRKAGDAATGIDQPY
jgi:hypothetical protein